MGEQFEPQKLEQIFISLHGMYKLPHKTTGYTPTELHLNKKTHQFWHTILKIPDRNNT